ncbi:MAG TPA: hypothetical protein VI504_16855 [Candidatus Eisenbacteria bacterium]|jgi:hypothetical protein
MKRTATTMFVLLVALLASAVSISPAAAALRSPQVAVVGGGLQAYLNSVGESINVNTDQDATQTWSHTVSGTTTYTIQFQSSPNAAVQQFGLYNASAVIPPLFFLMSGSVGPLGFSTATFKPGNIMVVNRFDALGNFLSTTTFGGVDPTNFGFYLTVPAGTVFTQDARNPGGLARAITFQGTGGNAGTWWLCWDEPLVGAPGDQDFDDLVVLLESVNPTPVTNTTWGQVKARFR